MSELHPTNQALLIVLENQVKRTEFAFSDLPEDIYNAEPGNDCNTIRRIGEHLIRLRQFQLMLLESPLTEQVPSLNSGETVPELIKALAEGAELVRRAINEHDPEDWYRNPESPREGPWSDEPTMYRITRPLNDFTNHLGGVRVIRRIMGVGVEQTQ